MLIGGDDNRNEALPQALPLARVFRCLFPLRADWRKSDSSVDGESGSQRRSCKLSFLFPPRRQSAPPRRACSQATRGKVNTTELGYKYLLPGALTAKYCYGFSSFTFYKNQISRTAEPRDGFYGFSSFFKTLYQRIFSVPTNT